MFDINEDVVLEIERLNVCYRNGRDEKRLVEDISIRIPRGQITCVVGESGSGKSLMVKSILGLLRKPLYREVSKIEFCNREISDMQKNDFRSVLKEHFSMIFQNPQSSLNPTMKIGRQLSELLTEKEGISKEEARSFSIESLEKVGILNPSEVYCQYPFQLSGGMCQRVMIAMALLKKSDILIADEPTTALDTVTQAEILRQVYALKTERQSTILLITHDLRVVAEMADYVYVMKGGRIVEENDVHSIFIKAEHPYTKDLIHSMY